MKTEAEARAELDRLIASMSVDEVRQYAASVTVALMYERIDRLVADEVKRAQAALEAQCEPSQEQIARATAVVAFEMLDAEGQEVH